MSDAIPLSTNESTLKDVKQLGLWASLASLSYVFWIVGAMEMIERLAYYGVRAVATIYATRASSEGGLGVTMATFGCPGVMSFIPMPLSFASTSSCF